MNGREQLEHTISTIAAQRILLGDSVVDHDRRSTA